MSIQAHNVRLELDKLIDTLLGAGLGDEKTFFLISKKKSLFLALPESRPAALMTLSLYSPQRPFALLMVFILRLMLKTGVRWPLQKVKVAFSGETDFCHFLKEVSSSKILPTIGIMAGIPKEDSQNLLFLVMDAESQTKTVVKASLSANRYSPLTKEISVLKEIPKGTPGVPVLKGTYARENQTALALDYIEGESLTTELRKELMEVLESWIHSNDFVRLQDLSVWDHLQKKAPKDVMDWLAKQLEGQTFRPALFHGDLTPWNCKLSSENGSLVVLDWERAELRGPSCWDLFHYLVQSALLVGRKNGAGLLSIIKTIKFNPLATSYLNKAADEKAVRNLFKAYFIYSRYVMHPQIKLPALDQAISLMKIKD